MIGDPLKWLLYATHVPPGGLGGGMVRYVVELTRALNDIDGVEAHVLARPGSAPFFTDLLGDADRVHRVPDVPTLPLSVLERNGVGIAALREEFDVIHGTKNFVPRWSKSTRVLTVHDMLLLDRPQDHPRLKGRLIRWPYLGSIRSADVVLCVSAATLERLRSYDSLAADRADVVPLAVSRSLLQTPPREVRALAGRRFALVVGDASPRKNLRLVVDAWSDVIAQSPEAVLAVVGPTGWGVVDYGNAYGDLRAREHLEPLGHVDDGALRWCYENAQVVLCPSLEEGFGLPAAEALAFASPLITSEDSALCEVSGDRALHLPGSDAEAWVKAIVTAFEKPRSRPNGGRDMRTWTQVAQESRDAVLRYRRAGGTRDGAALR